MSSAGCDLARRSFPDLVDGPADAGARDHLAECEECARRFEAFEAIVRDLGDLGQSRVPDPGPGYWEGFLPSVRSRLGATHRPARSIRATAVAACAAALMIAVSLAVLYAPSAPPRSPIDEVFEDARQLPPEEARRLAEAAEDWLGVSFAGPDLDSALDPEDVIQAIDQLQHPGGLTDLWHDQELERMIEGLDESQAALLKQELLGDAEPETGRRFL